MSIKHDPSAIRYASTQEAYGFTWPLDKIEPDGAQVWCNSKGQEAFVPKACEQVKQQLPASPVWKLLDIGQGNDAFKKVERKPISDDRKEMFKQYIHGTWENLEASQYYFSDAETVRVVPKQNGVIEGHTLKAGSTYQMQKGTPKRYEVGEERITKHGYRIRWDGRKWRNV